MSSMEAERTAALFEEIRARGQKAIDAGLLEEAVGILQTAIDLAVQEGDARQIDLTRCNYAAAMVEMGSGASEISSLREVLVRNGDPASCRLAAYTIARYYELTKNYKKALFYARIAMDRSRLIGRRDWLASSHNLIANTLMAESFVEPACEEYERALRLMGDELSPNRAKIISNLGYCRVLQGRYVEAYRLLYEGLRLLRSTTARWHEMITRLDLCFAHLETGRYRLAQRQGSAALAMAESIGDVESIKNALYLLGEAANLSGDVETATAYFHRLQKEFFPTADYLPTFLLAVNIRKLVNLHA